MAWTKNVLRVNLAAGTCTTEPLNMAWAHDYLGQRGLATKYYVSEVDPKVDPFSPENKLLFVTGPLTGTMAATGGRYSVVTKGPLTGAIACSNSGGYFGAELKFAGWDMVIVEGASPKPVYLLITDGHAELVDAAHLWGKTVWETEERIKAFHQDPQIRVAAIGRAGENRVLYAAIVNDLHRAAGRSGVGAVMGSKNLKAVAVRGTRTDAFQLANPDAFFAATEAGKKALAANGVTGQGLPTYGTQVLMNVINELGALPTRNHRDVQFEGAHDISGEAMHQKRPTDGKANLVTKGACFGCTIACGRISRMDPGHFSIKDKPQYQGASGGLEYEAAWALGAANGVSDLEALTYANFLCNEDGFDPISFGATVGAAMELYDLGILKKEDVGFELPFGSAEVLVRIAELTAKGEGFGKRDRARVEAALCQVRQARPLHERQGPGVPGLRRPRPARDGPRLRHQQPGRVPPARLHGVARSAGHPREDGATGHRRQARHAEGLPGSDRRRGLLRPLPLHHLRVGALRHPAADPGRVRRRLVRGAAADRRRAHLEHGARVQPRGGAHLQGRQPPSAPDEGACADGPAERRGVETRRDAAGVLPRAGVDEGRRSHRRDARTARCVNGARLRATRFGGELEQCAQAPG